MSKSGMPLFLTIVLASASIPASRAADEPATLTPPAEASQPVAPAEDRDGDRDQTVPDPAEMAADALVVRPLGLAATVVGAAIYVVALPFAAIAGDVRTPGRALVGAPARYTFKRRLGDFGPRHL